MSDRTSIEWSDASWNPVRGCTQITPGCGHCYAKTFAERFRGVPGHPYEQGFDLRLVPENLDLPRGWRKARRVFVNSMSDLFHEDVPEAFIRQVFDVMRETPQHTYQVLTKRSERMRDVLKTIKVPDHVWIGVSIERSDFVWRAGNLAEIDARVRWVSAEPLLGPLENLSLNGLNWVVVGGESGFGARPIESDWVRSLRDRCVADEVAFFFKQWGGAGIQKKKAGRLLDGVEWNQYPDEMPTP